MLRLTSVLRYKDSAEFNATTSRKTGKKTCLYIQPRLWRVSYVCVSLSVLEPSNLPVAILWRSLPHGERLAETQQAESIALTITTFPPHGSLSVVDLSLSGHIIVFKMPVVDPTKHKSHFLSIGWRRNMIFVQHTGAWRQAHEWNTKYEIYWDCINNAGVEYKVQLSCPITWVGEHERSTRTAVTEIGSPGGFDLAGIVIETSTSSNISGLCAVYIQEASMLLVNLFEQVLL